MHAPGLVLGKGFDGLFVVFSGHDFIRVHSKHASRRWFFGCSGLWLMVTDLKRKALGRTAHFLMGEDVIGMTDNIRNPGVHTLSRRLGQSCRFVVQFLGKAKV